MRVFGVAGVGGRLLLGLLVVCGCVLGWCGVALAGVGFVPGAGFGPVAPGGFVVPVGLGVDDSAGGSRGDVYVADQGSDVLYKFSAGGGLLGEKGVAGATVDGVAVDSYPNANEGDVLVAGLGSGVVYRFDSVLALKEELKGLAEPVGVAFDAAGSMFVAEIGGSRGIGKVLEFNAAGVPVDAEGTPSANNTVLEGFGEPRGLAVSASGEQLYLATAGGVGEYSLSSGAYGFSAQFGGESTTGVSVTANGDVYADSAGQVTVYEPSGAVLASMGAGAISSPAFGVGVNEATGGVYVADAGALLVDTFERGETPEAPGAPSVSGLTGTSATLGGTLASGGFGTSSYYFQYAQGPNCAGGAITEPAAGSGGSVHAEVIELAPSSEYATCLVATNAFGSTTGPGTTFSTSSIPPSITAGSESFSQVETRSATLTATVNSENLSANYRFLYGPPATFVSKPSSTPETSIPAGLSPVQVAAKLTGLEPGSEYDFRIIVTNSKHETTEGSIETLTTLREANTTLPDNRSYEMVTPASNHDANVYVPYAYGQSPSQGVETFFPFQVSSSGEAIAYLGDASIGGEGEIGKGRGDQYLATRQPNGGWQQTVIQPASHTLGTHFQGFSGLPNELSTGLLVSGNPAEPGLLPLARNAPGGGYRVLYARDDFGVQTGLEEGLYAPLFPNSTEFDRKARQSGVSANVTDGVKNGEAPVFAGVSAGGFLFEANDDLLSAEDPLRSVLDSKVKAEMGAGEESNFLYESVPGGTPSLVSVLPDGEPAPDATFGASATGNPRRNGPDFGGVGSSVGRWVYWTDEGSGVVYVRVDGSSTAQVSAGPARYWASSDNGRYAFYVENGGLFRYDAESGAREPLTATGVGVQGVLGASEDGEQVYVVTSSILAGSKASGEGKLPVEESGLVNLYLLEHGVSAPVFIATLSEADGSEAEPMAASFVGVNQGYLFGDWQPALGARTAGVSSGGVVFMSRLGLPVVGFPGGYPSGGADEVYVFERGGNRLVCVSCSSSGEPLHGGAAGFLPVGWNDVHLPEWVADGGDRVFFDSTVPLVAGDTNGRQDVYEWEREGTGSCEAAVAVNGGCVYLLSGGTSQADSWFIGASASGDDVFVATRAQLSPLDRNGAFDLYDVRVGGVQPVTAPLCTGTGCQGVPAPAPEFATPASVTFNGVGNFPPPTPSKPKPKPKSRAKCRKGSVRVRGKCVKKPKHGHAGVRKASRNGRGK